MNTSSQSDILTRILKRKKEEVEERKASVKLDTLKTQAKESTRPRGFFHAISASIAANKPAVIAEIKKHHRARASFARILIQPQ